MSDRIAVMNKGLVEQAASPRTIYEEPRTVFVADFLGVSNLLAAEAVGRDGGACAVRIGDRVLRCAQGELEARGDVKVMIRPERIRLEPHAATGDDRLPGIVERSVFLGGSHEIHVRVLGGELLRVTLANDGSGGGISVEPGAAVTLHLPAEALRVLLPSEASETPEEPEAEPMVDPPASRATEAAT